MSQWSILKDKGNIEYQKGNLTAAIELYSQAISKNNIKYLNKELDSKQDILFSNRGLCYLQINQIKNAEEDLIKAVTMNPTNVKANKRLSSIYLKTGKLRDSKLYLSRCANLDKVTDYKNDIEQVNRLIDFENKLNKEYQLNHFYECCSFSSELAEVCSEKLDFKLIHVECLLKSNQQDEAVNFLKTKFNDKEKLNEEVVYLTALAFYYEGRYDKAKSLLNSLMMATRKNNSKYEKLLSVLISIEEVKSSANNAYSNGNYDDAINKYLLIINVDPTNHNLLATIYANLALCKQKIRKLNEALVFIDNSIKYNPKYVKAYFRRGLINLDLYQYEVAEKDFKKALELDPSFKEAKIKIDEIEMEKEKKKRKDYYKILDVPVSADEKEIRQAFKKLAAKWHPDKNSSCPKNLEKAKMMFEDISEAYDVLSNKQKRVIYDSGCNVDNNIDDVDVNEEDILYKRAEEIYYKYQKKSYK